MSISIDPSHIKFYTVPTTLNSGIIGYWKLNETAGATLAVDSVNGNNGTLVNSPSVGVAGKIGTCYVFDPIASTRVDVGDIALLKVPQITISVWTKVSSSGYYGAVCMTDGALGSGYWIGTEGSKMKGKVGDNATHTASIISTTSINNNVWHHIVLTSDGVNAKLYINGVQEGGNQAFPYSIGYQSGVQSTLRFGARGNTPGMYFLGGLDEIGIWNRALTSAEITELYNAGSGKTYPF